MKTLKERKETTDLQIRGLKAKKAFLVETEGEFMPKIRIQAHLEGIVLQSEDRQRISQILNGNGQPVDCDLLGLVERTVASFPKRKMVA